jgi:hypothetical protein
MVEPRHRFGGSISERGEEIMGSITIDQSHQVLATLAANTDWVAVDFEGSGLQDFIVRNPKEAGRRFTTFLKNCGKVMVGGSIITIDRSVLFNAAEFIGKGWSFWRGPADGDGLQGALEQDEHSLALTEVDTSKIVLKTSLTNGEDWISGEENLKRLESASDIRLDLGIFWTFWKNQRLIPERFKEKTDENTTYVFCDGQTLRGPLGDRCALYFCWYDGRWDWGYDWLGSIRRDAQPSAVLAS